MAAPSSSHSLKEYLKRYQSCTDDPKTAKKKKKKEKPKPKSTGCGVLVVDEDPVWHKPVQLDDAEEEDNYTAEETPQVEVDIEVKRMKRLEVLRSLKPYHSINEDGSGWVSIPKPSGLSTAKNRDLSPQQNQNDSGNADLSPLPYQRRRRFDSPLMEMIDNPADSNTDLSPPCQRRRRLDTPSPEPQLNGPGGEASDQSPPRRRRAEDLSPPRRAKPRTQEVEAGRGLPEADLSPPRKKGQRPVVDLSPPRRHRESPEADSYPLSMTRKGPSNDFAPRRARSSPAADLSPPRRTRKGSSDDLSPRRDRKRSLKPTEVQSTSLSDLSHSMRGEYGSSENLSLPRRARHGSSEGSRNSYLPSADLSTVRIKESSLTNDERRGGLLSAKEMKEEIDRKRKQEKSRFASMNPLLTGRDAEAVHRDKEGKKISKEELKKSKQEEKKKEKPLEWGKGLAQKREAEERGKELELEKERPFARSRDDPELEMMLKERIRWGDPMAHLVKPKNSELILEDLGENEKMKESGFIIPQTIPSHSWLKRGLDFTPNRYGIRPGRHWDGVDRSNGYEKELFKRQNDKRATETEAYLWSVSDM